MSITKTENKVKIDPLGESYDSEIVNNLSSIIANLDGDVSKKMRQDCQKEYQKYSRSQLMSQTDSLIASLWKSENKSEQDVDFVGVNSTHLKSNQEGVQADLNDLDQKLKYSPYSNKKIAVFHHFFKGDCKGGGENWVLEMADYYKADIWVGGVDLGAWGPEMIQKDPGFAGRVWQDNRKFVYLHTESNKPIWKHLKRQLYFLFSPKVRELKKYDLVIFSYGNIAFVPDRIYGKIPW